MGSFTPCQPVYLYIFQTFFCEMTKRQQLKQQQQQNVATQIGQFWTPIMCDWTANFQQIILKHNGKKQVLNWHQECYASTIERDIPLGSVYKSFRQCRRGRGQKLVTICQQIPYLLSQYPVQKLEQFPLFMGFLRNGETSRGYNNTVGVKNC